MRQCCCSFRQTHNSGGLQESFRSLLLGVDTNFDAFSAYLSNIQFHVFIAMRKCCCGTREKLTSPECIKSASGVCQLFFQQLYMIFNMCIHAIILCIHRNVKMLLWPLPNSQVRSASRVGQECLNLFHNQSHWLFNMSIHHIIPCTHRHATMLL